MGFYASASLVSDTSVFESLGQAEALAEEVGSLIFKAPETGRSPAEGQPEHFASAEVKSPQRRALFRRMLGAGS